MKKVKTPFLVVAVIAILSAFATKVDSQQTLVGKNLTNPADPYPVVQADEEDLSWRCLDQMDTCLFTPKPGATAPYDRSELDPISSRIGKKFQILEQ